MKTYNYSEVKRNFSAILNIAMNQEVIVRQRNGRKFRIVPVLEQDIQSPFDVTGINTNITTNEMIEMLKESREMAVI